MTAIAIAVVLASALLHACWNYLAKRSTQKVVFIWWFLLGSAVIYFPMFVYFKPQTGIGSNGWLWIFASGVIHFLYFYFLGRAYERGDLSLVYPLSRGMAPLMVALLAIGLVGERIHLLGWIGIILVVLGIFTVHLRSFSRESMLEPFAAMHGEASVWAILTGLTIAAYSLVDKVGVRIVAPPVYIYLMNIVSLLLLSPVVLISGTGRIVEEWRRNRSAIALVSVLVTGSYLMILFALQIANVSYVVAVREVSVVFSVLFGVFQLKERYGLQKLTGAVLILLGVVTIGLV